jgi:hypothetical protein
VANAVRTTVCEPAEFSIRIDDCVEGKRCRAEAEAAWVKLEVSGPGTAGSADFACGFKEGFATFLFEGGSGNPPPVPPRYYWRPKFDSVQGHQAIEDWFTGYRVGSAAARESGLRQLVTVPASTALPRRADPYSLGSGGAVIPGSELLMPPAEGLPPPREIPRMPPAVAPGGNAEDTVPVSEVPEVPAPAPSMPTVFRRRS